MSTILSTLGIGADSEKLYRHVLRQDGLPAAAHAEALGWSLRRTEVVAQSLVAARLLREDLEGALVAPHPRAALTRLVDRENALLELRRRELEEVAAAVGDFSAEHLAGRAHTLDPSALDVIDAETVPSTVEYLLSTTTGPILSFHLGVASGVATEAGVERRTREAVAAGRDLRAIYPTSVLDREDEIEWVREWAALGERQRIVEHVPAEFVVFGDAAVLAAPTWGEEASTAVLLRMPLLVHAFAAVFEDAWAGGLPVPDQLVEQDVETRLLALLGTGFKDEAIARYLGIGVRTVRRRVAALMDELGVHTRFQLGAVAERRGLLRRRTR